jgi:hypothetical protein
MKYSSEASAQVERDYRVVQPELRALFVSLASVLAPSLKSEKAREYVIHGVCRRLMIIHRCIENIFTIYPLNRTSLLNDEERINLEINLHAFLINVHGIPDNLAWSYVLEHDSKIDPKLKEGQVSLFKKETKKHLPIEVREYVNSADLSNWHKQYAKDYRDALAHRIPPYIPPSIQTPAHQAQCKELEARMVQAIEERNVDLAEKLFEEQNAIGSICGAFKHSLGDSEAMLLHPQIIVDAKTVMQIVNTVHPHITLR